MQNSEYRIAAAISRYYQTDQWSYFLQKMAEQIIYINNLSDLCHQPVNELNSEIGLCPCGQGFVVINVVSSNNYYQPTQYIPYLCCRQCQHEFQLAVSPMAARQVNDFDLAVACQNQQVSFPCLVHSLALWKLIAVNGLG